MIGLFLVWLLIDVIFVDKFLFIFISNFILMEFKMNRFIFCYIVILVFCYFDSFKYGIFIKIICILDIKRYLFYYNEFLFYVLFFNGECKVYKN